MPAPTAERMATRLRQVRLARRADDAPHRTHTWDLIRVALAVPAATALVLLVLIGITTLLAGDGIGGVGTATAAGWLVVNQVPLTVGGVTVAALPLLPTLAMLTAVYLVCSRASRDADSIAEVASVAGAALGGPLLATALALAVVADGSAVTSIGQPDPLPAFGYTLAVQLLGVLAGVGKRCLEPVLEEFDPPVSDRVGVRGGVLAVAVLVTGGALMVFAGLITHWDRIAGLIERGHSFSGFLGLTVLSVLYLPNIVIGGVGLAVGAHAQVGTVTFDSLASDPGSVPPLPILGVVPEVGAGSAGLVTFVIPLIAALMVGWFCRSVDAISHLRAVVVAGAVAAAMVVVGVKLASGQAGELGRVWISPATAGVYTFGWIVVVGGLVAGAYALLPALRSRKRSRVNRAGADDDFDLDALLDEEDFGDLEIIDDLDEYDVCASDDGESGIDVGPVDQDAAGPDDRTAVHEPEAEPSGDADTER
ncbi:MAG: DUF6350 family protein [Gordonia sp. (in: high G+C Gram-positive bacteria)]